MDNNNERSQSWTDPITGEVYGSGNPHVSIQKSVAADPSVQVRSFRDQTPDPQPQAREVYPQQPIPQPQQQTVRQMQTTVQQAQAYGNIPQMVQRPQSGVPIPSGVTKFCAQCGNVIAKEAVVCPLCGCQVAAFQQIQPAVIINNNNGAVKGTTAKDKWLTFFLCFFLGFFGIHRFYEGKFGTGILFLMTGGVFGIGWLVDIIRILCLPNPYYV